MRGYFGIGVENISKPRNVGALMRTAHAFGASFVFAVAPEIRLGGLNQTDTSKTAQHVPFYTFDSAEEILLPRTCSLVGVELMDDAIDLPSFRHPERAAYILGPEAGSLSPEIVDKCEFVVKIPTKFCVNVSVAGALIMYDRLISRGRRPDRPVRAGGPMEDFAPPVSNRRRKIRTAKQDD